MFWVSSSTKDWLRHRCKPCRKEYSSEYYKKNKDKISIRWKKYYKENKESILNKNKQWYQNNKDKHLQLTYKRRANNPDVSKEIKKRYIISEKWRIKNRLWCANRRARKNNWDLPHHISYRQIKDIMVKQWWECAITWEALWDNFHIDHITPLSKWWKHTIDNIQLTTPSANMKKWNRLYCKQ